MGYLQPADYAAFGLSADTADAWVTAASAMMEAYCKRPSLLAASYTERMRVPHLAQTVRLSYTPLISVDVVQAQYARPRFGDDTCGDGIGGFGGYGPGSLAGTYIAAFALPYQWVPVDVTTLDISLPTGEFRFPWNMMGIRYGQAEVTYTAGLTTVPDALTVACAQIVKNAQATPGLNVKSSRMDTLQTQYFSDSLLDAQVQAILRPYVAERLG